MSIFFRTDKVYSFIKGEFIIQEWKLDSIQKEESDSITLYIQSVKNDSLGCPIYFYDDMEYTNTQSYLSRISTARRYYVFTSYEECRNKIIEITKKDYEKALNIPEKI